MIVFNAVFSNIVYFYKCLLFIRAVVRKSKSLVFIFVRHLLLFSMSDIIREGNLILQRPYVPSLPVMSLEDVVAGSEVCVSRCPHMGQSGARICNKVIETALC